MDGNGELPKPAPTDIRTIDPTIEPEANRAGENLIKPDPLQTSFALANKAFEVASMRLKDQGENEGGRYDHLESVVDLGHVLPLGDEVMTDSLQKLGYDIDHAKAIPAIYMGERGGIKVDAVAIREAADIKPIIMLHEFVHRAADQRGLQGKAVSFQEQMYELLEFSKETREEMKRNSPDEYKAKLADTKEKIRCFNEGITQWATLYLANKTPEFNPPVADEVYSGEVMAIRESFVDFLNEKGFLEDQIDGLMLDLALTGDFSKVKAALPLDENMKQFGYEPDYYVFTLVDGTYGSFLVSKIDHILGQESQTENLQS